MRRKARWRLSAAFCAVALLVVAGAARSEQPAFSGEAAKMWVVRQCALGPRVPGTPAHTAWLRMVHSYFDSLQVPCREERFVHPSPLGPDTLNLTNLVASFRPGARPRLLLGAHWDSRPWADEDPDPAARKRPVLGANDGASGAGVLLELARILKASPPPLGVDLAFFDGEDLGREGHPEEYCLGSQWMAEQWTGPPPDWVIVLDMVGSPGMELSRELYSRTQAPDLVELIFRIAREKGYPEWDPGSRDGGG